MTGTKKSLLPTRKWVVQQVGAVGTWLIAAVNAGWHIGPALQITAIGIGVAAVAAWLTPNANTPAGVPRR